MTALFSKPKMPDVQPITYPKTPEVPPVKEKEVEKVKEEEKKKIKKGREKRSTILTSARGILEEPAVALKRLLGE